MGHLEKQVKTIARLHGAALVGVAAKQRLSDAPPSGDPTYLLPSAQSIISFAIPYESGALDEFIRKNDWLPFNLDKKKITQRLYRISDRLVGFLQREGFEALGVEVNNNYRPEAGVRDVSEVVRMDPDFSHRYGAVAAGVGRLGWSGNLMTPPFGSAVLLGTVLTSARLESDPLVEENPCDGCKMCVASCPVGMIDPHQSVRTTVAGITEKIAAKRTNNCCWIGCDGYHGLSPDAKWSNWSPYRVNTPLPGDDRRIDELCTRLRKSDPDASPDELNIYTHYREAFFHPDYLFFSVCGHCANICRPHRRQRTENWKMLRNAGIVVLRADGRRSAVPETADIVEIDIPFGVRAAMLRNEYEAALRGDLRLQQDGAATLTDRMVLQQLRQSISSRGKT